jgi:hypothetical protein
VGDLRLALRSLLVDQGFVIVHAHVSKLKWGITPEELLAMRRTRLDQGTDRAIGRGGDHKNGASAKVRGYLLTRRGTDGGKRGGRQCTLCSVAESVNCRSASSHQS